MQVPIRRKNLRFWYIIGIIAENNDNHSICRASRESYIITKEWLGYK